MTSPVGKACLEDKPEARMFCEGIPDKDVFVQELVLEPMIFVQVPMLSASHQVCSDPEFQWYVINHDLFVFGVVEVLCGLTVAFRR